MVSPLARKALAARACVSLLLANVSLSNAQVAESLDLPTAVVRSLQQNLDLKAFAYELEAQQGLNCCSPSVAYERQSCGWPKPSVGSHGR